MSMICLSQLLLNQRDWIYPKRQKRSIDDLMIYKRNITDIRNSVLNKKICRISYIKKTTKQIKQYFIDVKSYYINRDTKQCLIFAIDRNDLRQKTFLLCNVLSVQRTDMKSEVKQFKIN